MTVERPFFPRKEIVSAASAKSKAVPVVDSVCIGLRAVQQPFQAGRAQSVGANGGFDLPGSDSRSVFPTRCRVWKSCQRLERRRGETHLTQVLGHRSVSNDGGTSDLGIPKTLAAAPLPVSLQYPEC